jgi:hypothetical protein
MIAYTNSDDGAAYVVRADGGAPPERALQSSEVDYYMPLWRPTH